MLMLILILVTSLFSLSQMELIEEALAQGITPAIVVAIYLIITKIIDNRKENVQLKLNAELTKSINSISSFLTDITKNIIDKDKDKCKAAIEDTMFSSGMRLINFVSTTIINNHVESNKDTVIGNVHNIVNAEFYSVYATLSLYKINGVKASDALNKDWMEIIEKDILDVIYNSKLEKEDKILSFTNKINLKFQSYVTHMTNTIIR